MAANRHSCPLLEHFEQVELVPVFDEHAVVYAPDVNRAHFHRVAARGDSHQLRRETPVAVPNKRSNVAKARCPRLPFS